MNKVICLLFFFAALPSSQAFHDMVFIPLLAGGESESEKYGYRTKCLVADEVTVTIEIVNPAALKAMRSVTLTVRDENGHHMDMHILGSSGENGLFAIVVHLPKAWAEKSSLCIQSKPYDGAAPGVGSISTGEGPMVETLGYSIEFKNVLKK